MSEKVYIAKESTSQNILGKIGAAEDSGDTTLFGKMNAVYEATEKGILTKVMTGVVPETETTILDVSGKGALHSFAWLIGSSAAQDGTIKIILDGNVIVNGKFQNGVSQRCLVYVGDPAEVHMTDTRNGSGAGCPFFTCGNVAYALTLNPLALGALPLSATEWTIAKTSNNGVYFIPGSFPLSFNSSLQIICKAASITSGGQDRYGCLYELR